MGLVPLAWFPGKNECFNLMLDIVKSSEIARLCLGEATFTFSVNHLWRCLLQYTESGACANKGLRYNLGNKTQEGLLKAETKPKGSFKKK